MTQETERPYEGTVIIAKVSRDCKEFLGLTDEQALYCIDYISDRMAEYLEEHYPGADIECCFSGHTGRLLAPLVRFPGWDSNNASRAAEAENRGWLLQEEIRSVLNEMRATWVREAERQSDYPL